MKRIIVTLLALTLSACSVTVERFRMETLRKDSKTAENVQLGNQALAEKLLCAGMPVAEVEKVLTLNGASSDSAAKTVATAIAASKCQLVPKQ